MKLLHLSYQAALLRTEPGLSPVNFCHFKTSAGGSFAKLGAQYITRDSKIGCADSAFSLLLAQILGAQMRTFAH